MVLHEQLYLDMDLPDDVVYRGCPVSAWPESTQVTRDSDR